MKASELSGRSVVSTEQGTIVGHIEDMYFNPADGMLTEFEVETGSAPGALARVLGQKRWVRRAAWRGLGPDALTIDNEVSLLKEHEVSAELKAWRRLGEALGESVITESGTNLGKISNFEIDADKLQIVAIEVRAGVSSLGGLLRAETAPQIIQYPSIVKLGPDVVVVAEKSSS